MLPAVAQADSDSFLKRFLDLATTKPYVIVSLALGFAAGTGTGILWPAGFPNWTAWTAAVSVGLMTFAVGLIVFPVVERTKRRVVSIVSPPALVITVSSG